YRFFCTYKINEMTYGKLIAFVLLLAACSGKKTKLRDPVNIPGTRVMMSLPKNYSVSKKFIGVEKGRITGILIYDMSDGNYFGNAKTFDRKTMEAKGAKVFEYAQTTVDGYPAKFLYMQGDPSKAGMMLVFGDSTFSCSLMAAFIPGNDVLAQEIKDILMHVQYDKKIRVNPFDIAGFTLDSTVSRFKFASYNAGMYTYSVNGVKKQSYENEPLVIVTQLPSEGVSTAKETAKAMLISYQQKGFFPYQQPIERNTSLNGYEAYEAILNGTSMGDTVLFYQLATLKDEKIFVFQGIAKNEFGSNLEEFKRLGYSMRLK
ncbi:MAG TPA: hypothetical protein VD905_15010, partial [Flavobacteriales bacterium]|nr:hypothetical protein [Flavobacteriales bacterium]